MAELIAAGGCWNANRFAVNGAGADLRDWRGAIETNQTFTDGELLILAACFDGDDMNVATGATFKLQWANNTDSPTTWNDLASTGELKWSSSTDLVNAATLASAAYADSPSSINCTNKGPWTVESTLSEEVEGANEQTISALDDELLEIHWAVDLAGADAANGDAYQFRIVDTADSVIGTGTGLLTVVAAGKIDGTTYNADRTTAEPSVLVAAFENNSGVPGAFVSSVTSHASTGVYSLTVGIISGDTYFLHGYLDAATDKSDGSILVTAVDA